MRVLSFRSGDVLGAGIVDGDRVLPLVDGDGPLTMRELLERGLLGRAAELADERQAEELSAITFTPPVPDARAVWCAALTFATHVKEAPGRAAPEYPLFFLRVNDSHVGHCQPIVRPSVSEQLDYEGELA